MAQNKNKTVLHISTECFPMAKAGGMADVVGSLPLYLKNQGWEPSVIIPKYTLKWFKETSFKAIFAGSFEAEGKTIIFEVYKANKGSADFDFYCIDIPGRFDRDSIYLNEHGHGFSDEAERNVSFQRSVLRWLQGKRVKFDLLHCHDHQVGFIPFLAKKVKAFSSLKKIPIIYTIHNGAYNSRYQWNRRDLLPEFPIKLNQYLDWDGHIDSAATALRLADHVSTVSPTYLDELKGSLGPLDFMMDKAPEKFSGILNGIDNDVWDPKSDPLLRNKLSRSWDQFKKVSKASVLKGLYRVEDMPLISFIGRFAHQKGGDLVVPAVERILARFGFVNFYILGSGDKYIEQIVNELRNRFEERVACYIGYNETLAHELYAASDFILMPSRFEPCGLNQMFAMRYGAIPIARKTGGLKDTVVDFEAGGLGIAFDYDSVDDLVHAMARGLKLFKDKKKFNALRSIATKKDHSWTSSAKKYADIYNKLISER